MALLVLFLCCAIGIGAWAAEEPAPKAEQYPADQEEIDADSVPGIEADDEAEPEAPDGESPDTFIPSEDISESISVKFPVDI